MATATELLDEAVGVTVAAVRRHPCAWRGKQPPILGRIVRGVRVPARLRRERAVRSPSAPAPAGVLCGAARVYRWRREAGASVDERNREIRRSQRGRVPHRSLLFFLVMRWGTKAAGAEHDDEPHQGEAANGGTRGLGSED